MALTIDNSLLESWTAGIASSLQTLIIASSDPADLVTISGCAFSPTGSGPSVYLTNGPLSAEITMGGTASSFRVCSSGGTTTYFTGTVGLSGSGADLIVSDLAFTTGATFQVNSLTLTIGNCP